MTEINQNNIKNLINKMDDIKINENKTINNTVKNKTVDITNDKEKPVLTFHYNKDLPQPSEERLQYLREQFKKLQAIPLPEQRTDEWYEMRKNKITASDWAAALGKNPYSYRNKLIRAKCGEQQSFYGGHMQHGVKYEPVATNIYECRNNTPIIEFGLIPHPKIDYLGASPDGITADGVMLEIKCPPKRVITGEPPLYYWIQVQGQLEVCELDRCDFLECKIIEYETTDEVNIEPVEQYFNDNYNGDYHYNNLGLEKGIVLVFMHRTTHALSYEYSKLGINYEEFDKWREEVCRRVLEEDDMLYYETSFWKLTEISNVPIYRDKEWFDGNLPELKRFWDDVLHYREVGIEEIKPKPRKKKTPVKEIFIDTNISDFNGISGANFTTDNLDLSKFKTQSFFSDTPVPVSNNNNDSYNSNNSSGDEYVDKFKKQSFFSDDTGGGDTNEDKKKIVKIKIKKSKKPVSDLGDFGSKSFFS